MANILDDICDEGPVLSAPLSRPKGITKRQVERCIHELSEHWSDEQLNAVIDMFQSHGLLRLQSLPRRMASMSSLISDSSAAVFR